MSLAVSLLRSSYRLTGLEPYQLRNSVYVSRCRFFCAKPEEKTKKDLTVYDAHNVKRKVDTYVFSRFFNYVKNYPTQLEKKFPKAMHTYRIFMVGVKDFYHDMKTYFRVMRNFNSSPDGFRALSRRDMELYYQMPKDMMKVAPVLFLSALPFANYVIFPLALMFPRQLLCHHFWSIQQRLSFQQIYLKKRLEYNRKLFRQVQFLLDSVAKDPHYKEWKFILAQLGSGHHPSVEQIIEVRDIFSRGPLFLESLSQSHLTLLCGQNGIHRGWLKSGRLAERSYIVHHMDLAIEREGGAATLPIEGLRYCCYLRGLNPSNMSQSDMVEWLNNWVKVSLIVNGSNISLFLHLPILIGYNHPSNWQLLHSKDR